MAAKVVQCKEEDEGKDCMKCAHCGKCLIWNAGRGLCSKCYRKEEIRLLYQPTRVKAVNHESKRILSIHDRPLPKHPTDAQPGSLEKLQVLMQRASNGEALWHPLDRTCFGEKTIKRGRLRILNRVLLGG